MTDTAVTIRPAQRTDLAAINEIYNHAVVHSTATFQIEPVTLEQRQRWFDEHPPDLYPVFVAEVDGRVAGWGSLSRYATRCAYRYTSEDSIYVAHDHQRMGIGSKLLQTLIHAARTAGHHSIIAQIADHNPPSLHVHEKFGFVTVGEISEAGYKFGRWLDITLMQQKF